MRLLVPKVRLREDDKIRIRVIASKPPICARSLATSTKIQVWV